MPGPFGPCDRCGVPSYVLVLMGGGGELEFCAHHATKYWRRLQEVAFHIDDRRAQNRCGCQRCTAAALS